MAQPAADDLAARSRSGGPPPARPHDRRSRRPAQLCLGRTAARCDLATIFLRGWRRLDFGAPLLPSVALRCPRLLRVFEPLPGDTRPRAMALRARLVAAAFIADTEPRRSGKLYAYVPAGRVVAWSRLLMTGVMESVLLLPRSIISRWMWQ